MREAKSYLILSLLRLAVAVSAYRRSNNLRHLQVAPVEHRVRLFISLEYLREEVSTSLESKATENPVVAHFCRAVNYQASGAQVQAYSKALSATITTKVNTEETVPDYECRILGTNRITDEEGGHLFDDERVFVLEVAVEQTVYVSGQITVDQISGIVESGFGRGDGGRIKFRSLLQQSQSFNTLVNVEVLRQLSSPFDVATNIPTTSPTDTSLFTLEPTMNMTLAQSDLPSFVPSSTPTQRLVSIVPSEAPTLLVTSVPSSSSFQPIGKVSTSRNTQPLIFGAIAGGLATIAVSCFFILCVWFPFCRNKRRHDGDSRNKHSGPTEVNSSNRDTAIPETLHLDDDSRSLANTTVTLGDKSAKKTPAFKSMNASDSFDETSIYTSTLPVSPERGRFYSSPDRKLIETVEESNEIEIDEEDSDDGQSSLRSSYWDVTVGRDEHLEDSRSTKGLDVFSEDDESSYDFGSSIALSDPSFGPTREVETEYRPTPSPSSTKTRRTMNLVSRRSSYVGEEEMKSDRADGRSVLSPLNQISSERSQSLDNNALLRTILENARDRRKIGSSKTSLSSAPPRIHDLRQNSFDARNAQNPEHSTRLDHHLFKTQPRGRLQAMSTRSVGAYSRPTGMDYPLFKPSASLSGRSVSSGHSHVSRSQRPKNPYFPNGSSEAELYKTAMVSPSSSDSAYGMSGMSSSGKCDAPGVLGIARLSSAAPSMAGSVGSISRRDVKRTKEKISSRSGTSGAWSVQSVQSDGTFSAEASQSTSDSSSKELGSPTRTKSKISTLEYDLERIGQLSSFSRDDNMVAVSVTSADASRATYPTKSTTAHGTRKQRVIVVAPPGKIGVVLINRHDGRGTLVSEIRSSSSVKGLLHAGDKLVAVDGHDVTGMDVKEITSMMSSRSDKERRLTIISSRSHRSSRWGERAIDHHT